MISKLYYIIINSFFSNSSNLNNNNEIGYAFIAKTHPVPGVTIINSALNEERTGAIAFDSKHPLVLRPPYLLPPLSSPKPIRAIVSYFCQHFPFLSTHYQSSR